MYLFVVALVVVDDDDDESIKLPALTVGNSHEHAVLC